jgi:hypothetical protein
VTTGRVVVVGGAWVVGVVGDGGWVVVMVGPEVGGIVLGAGSLPDGGREVDVDVVGGWAGGKEVEVPTGTDVVEL